jgi:type IV pilus assembly protein PilM
MFFSGKKRDVIGIDLGSSSVKLVHLKEYKGGYQLQNIGMLPLPPEAIVDNTLMDSASIVEAIKNLISSLGIKATDAVASVSGNSVIIRKIVLPAMSVEELDDQIQWEAEQYIPFDINDVNLDFQVLGPDSVDPGKMHVLLVASKKDIVNDYLTVFSEAGLKLQVVDVDSFAVQNAFEANYLPDPDDVFALINIGASVMNINVVKDGISLFTRDVQLGGNQYTEELQRQFGIGTEQAEQLKLANASEDKQSFDEVIARVNDSISVEIRRSLDFYSANSLDAKIAKIFLSGGAAKTDQLVEAVEQRLDIPVELLDPFKTITFNENNFDGEYLKELGPIAVVAVGLAMRRAGDK